MSARHGTPYGYKRGCRCDACRAAHAEYCAEYRATHWPQVYARQKERRRERAAERKERNQ